MRILVSCVPYDSGKSGISVYMKQLIEEMKTQGHDLTLLVEPGASSFFSGFKTVELPRWTRRALFSMIWHLFFLPFQVFRMRKAFDFCVLGAANRRTFAFYPLYTVAVVHDLAQYHVKAKYDGFRMIYLKYLLPFFVRRAPGVMAISQSTADDLIRYWRVAPGKIFLNYNGLSLPEGEKTGWLEENHLTPGGYLLYVSRIEHPGKNHLNLIRAYEKLCRKGRMSQLLVLAGSDWHGADVVHEYVKQSPYADRIRFTGFLPAENLPEAYRNAACYVFPSFFEGFGLSLIEAMYYGVPCCASETSSLGEIGKGAALLFAPRYPDSIADTLSRVLKDPALRRKMIASGKKKASEFRWDSHVRNMVENYEKNR